MSKWGEGELGSGSKKGKKVPKGKKGQKQAIAIMLSEQRAEKAHGGKYPEKKGNRYKADSTRFQPK